MCGKTVTRIKENTATGQHIYNGYVCKVCGDYSTEAPIAQGLLYAELKDNGDVVAYSVDGIGEFIGTELLIPKTYNGKPITSIGRCAFYKCSSLTSIEIPDRESISDLHPTNSY